MESANKFAPLVGRVLISQIFIMSGLSKISGWTGTADYMAAHGMPAVHFLLFMAILVELGGGLSLLLGYKARLGAVALFLFLIPTTLIFHNFWAVAPDQGQARMMQMIMFMKNLAIMGGLSFIVGFGPGCFSLDNKCDKKRSV